MNLYYQMLFKRVVVYLCTLLFYFGLKDLGVTCDTGQNSSCPASDKTVDVPSDTAAVMHSGQLSRMKTYAFLHRAVCTDKQNHHLQNSVAP